MITVADEDAEMRRRRERKKSARETTLGILKKMRERGGSVEKEVEVWRDEERRDRKQLLVGYVLHEVKSTRTSVRSNSKK